MISVCIPTYEMPNGIQFLKESFDILKDQSLKDFEVVITDDSAGDSVKKFCSDYQDLNYGCFTLRYIKNLNTPGMAGNTNTAIQYANGELIKILYQDDRLAHKDALRDIVNSFDNETHWLVTGCVNENSTALIPHFPAYNYLIHKGYNTIGSPSVLTIRNQNPLLFNPKLTWVLDCDYYRRLYDKFGSPTILQNINVIIRIGEHQTTHTLSNERKLSEINYLAKLYDSIT